MTKPSLLLGICLSIALSASAAAMASDYQDSAGPPVVVAGYMLVVPAGEAAERRCTRVCQNAKHGQGGAADVRRLENGLLTHFPATNGGCSSP